MDCLEAGSSVRIFAFLRPVDQMMYFKINSFKDGFGQRDAGIVVCVWPD